ncbi:MAG: tRNA pseudouridine(13) synthase TruD [Gemmataceae bacterium]
MSLVEGIILLILESIVGLPWLVHERNRMLFDPLALPPLLTADLPGIGGRLKTFPEDFEVDEIPAYEPSGQGEFLFLRIEKRDMGAEYFQRQISHRLSIPISEVGMAGLKDRHAVTRQIVSVPAQAECRLSKLEGDGIRLISVNRHTNKLKSGHLRGNRFRVLVRDLAVEAQQRLQAILERIREFGLPNYYGLQRFGRDGETVTAGLALLRGEPPPRTAQGQRANLRSPFLRKLALSAAQSALFNYYLAQRLADGLLRKVLAGDVMAKWPSGGMFITEDLVREQERFDNRETVHAGPMFGRKTFAASGEAAAREAAVLEQAGLTICSFNGFGKLLQGTRRHNVVYFDDLGASFEPEGVRLTFTLPTGSYATVLLREITKADEVESSA